MAKRKMIAGISDPLAFLLHDGEMADRIRRHDWSKSLGPIETWPRSLKTTVGVLVHSPMPIVLLWGEQGVMIYNDAYARFAGRRHPDILGLPVLEAWPEVADFNANVMKVGMAGGTLTYADRELQLDRTGAMEHAWLDLGYSPVIAEDGKPGGVIAIVIDTTERVLATRRKAEEQERQRRLFEQAPGFIIVMSGPDHTVEFVNDKHRRLFNSAGWVGKPMREAFPSIAGQGFYEALDKVYATGEPLQFSDQEVRYRREPGGPEEVRYFNFSYAPTFDERGKASGVFCEGVDVTEARAARDALRTSEDRLRLATEAAHVGTWDYNPESGELRWDARCKELFGLPPDAAVTYEGSFLAGLHPEDRERVAAAVQAALDEGKEYSVEYRTVGQADTQERWVAARGRAIHEPGRPKRFIGTIREISARKRAERRLEIVSKTGSAVAGEHDLEKIVQIVTDAGVELTGAQFGAFFYNLVDEKGERYTLYTLSGAPRSAFENFPMPRNTEVFGPTFAGEGIVRSDDIRKDPRYGRNAPRKGMPEGHLPVTSYLAVPVVSRSGEVLGGLFFGHKEPGRFDLETEGLVTAVADQAAIAIDNAQLFAAARDANAQLEAVNHSLEARVQQEVAARMAAEKSARSTSEQFRMLVQSVVDYAIYMLDLDGNVSTWNAGAERIKGYPANEVIGKHFSMFYPEEGRAAGEPQRLLEEARTKGRMAFDAWRVRKDGTRFWASVVIDVVRNDEGAIIGFAKVTRDITEQREAARQLEITREALFQAQKMESIGQLTGGIAHDFNNMLAVVLGGLNLMQRRLQRGDVNVGKYIEGAIEGANRAASLTKRLLAFSRQQPLEPAPIDGNKLVASMTELLSRTLGEHIEVETVLSPELWRCFADTVQLESAVLNLAVNARDAMPSGGKLTIETGNALVDHNVAREYGVPEGQYVLIAVSDTGTGMTEEVKAQAFDPFFTTKSVGKGSGLGLSQVFGFMRQSGGHVKLYSELGVGTTVKLYLPRHTGPDSQRAEEGRGENLDLGSSSEVVLVVEDDERVRNYSIEALKELGYAVVAAEGPRQALRLIEEGRRIDLLFTDIVMPDMNGRQLAEKAVAALPDLKVLFTTGYTRNAVVHNGVLDAGTTLLQKPFTIDQLAQKVRQALDG